MTTLKTYHADEIASAMSAQLEDEGFVSLYRTAQSQWWKGPAGAQFKAKADAIKTEQERDAVLDMLNDPDFKTRLGKEGVSDETELQNYVLGKQLPAAAEDGQCPKCGKASCACDQAMDGCPKCADAGLAVAIDFAIRHMVKVADALDKVGFVGVATLMDKTIRRLAAERPFVVKTARSYKGWVVFLKKKSPKAAEKFQRTYKGALEHAKKEKGLGADKAEEYAMRTALDGVPKSYLKEPTPEHGKGKSGPKVTKKAATREETADFKRKLGVKPDRSRRHGSPTPPTPGVGMFGKDLSLDEIVLLWNAIPDIMKDQVLPDWRKADEKNLTYNLSNPEVQKRLWNWYDQWNRRQLGKATPAPQAGKRSKYYSSRLVGQVQKILNQGGVPVKVDNSWGPNTAKAWNEFLNKAGLSTYSKADPRGVNPPIEDMRLLVNYGDQILAGMKPSAAKPAAPAAKPAAKPAKPPQVVDVEEPPPAGETERQKELRKQFPGVVGYNPNRPNR